MHSEKTQFIQLSETVEWDTDSKTLLENDTPLEVTPNMIKLMTILTENIERPVNSVDIFFHVWDGFIAEYNPKLVRNLISSLRIRINCLDIENHYGGRYILKRYKETAPDLSEFMIEIFKQAKNGFTITDPHKYDNPLIFVNDTFLETFGYTAEEVLGRNCRLLQGNDHSQEEIKTIREAINNQQNVTAVVKNYTKDGQLLHNEVTITPIFEGSTGKLKYFFGVQKILTSVNKNEKRNT